MCDFFRGWRSLALSYLFTQTDRDHLGGITILYKIEEFVIVIYCLIEDELYPAFLKQHGRPRRAGFPPALSDSECLTIELVGQYLGSTRQKQLYGHMHDRFGAWFPALRSRGAFTRQCANLWQVKAWRHQQVVEHLGGHQAACQVMDTLPVPICHVARRFQRRIFRTESVGAFPEPTLGYCAAKDERYFGFKGGLRITDYGLIVQAPLLPAYGHDSTCCDPLLAGVPVATRVRADAAFIGLDRQQHLQQNHHLHLLTPLKGNMRRTEERKPFCRSRWGPKAPTTNRNRLCPISPTLPRPSYERARCLASTEPVDHQNTDALHRRLDQHTTQKKTARLRRTRTNLKVTHHVP